MGLIEQLKFEIVQLEKTNQVLAQQIPQLSIKDAEAKIAELQKQKELLQQGIERLKSL